MDSARLQQIASQLRQPQGQGGIEVGRMMNANNEFINRRAIRQLAVQAGDRILELGPGNGYFARDIVGVDASVRYVGCDLSLVMVEQANQINADLVQADQARFVERTSSRLPFDDASFDKLLTVNTLYFWEDPAAELAEIRRVLVPGGLLVIGIRPRWVMEQMAFVTYGFTLYEPEQAGSLLTSNGFILTNLIVEREADQVFFQKTIAMEMALVCGQSPS